MRTKTLLLTAALVAAGAATSMAQTVYSVNAVGYINLPLGAGFNLIANQLNGTPDNKLKTVIPLDPAGSQDFTTYLAWDNVAQGFAPPRYWLTAASGAPSGNNWYEADFTTVNSTATFAPGEGAFLNVGTPFTLTLVGEVPQGTLNVPIVSGFNCIAIKSPQQLTLTGAAPGGAELAPGDFDQIIRWSNASGGFSPSVYFVGGGWVAGDFTTAVPAPSPAVGEGFFYNAGAPATWTRTFNVSP